MQLEQDDDEDQITQKAIPPPKGKGKDRAGHAGHADHDRPLDFHRKHTNWGNVGEPDVAANRRDKHVPPTGNSLLLQS